jgi:phosphoribosyl-AMP cyclohydrolase / phosphoribosyl-ATP pyrophosphohydrolase
VQAAGSARVTIAGGVTTAEEIRELDKLGADAQVGMAIYTGKLSLEDAFTAPFTTDRGDGLWPTVVCNERGVALGLAWSNRESLEQAIALRRGVYYSRSRKAIWIKGETSKATQDLLRIDVDCDRDALRFMVKQNGEGFCHNGTESCWGDSSPVDELERVIRARMEDAPEGSYTRRLLNNPDLLSKKIVEEASELASAGSLDQAVSELADVFYFGLVKLIREGGRTADLERVLAARRLKVNRRGGDAKE